MTQEEYKVFNECKNSFKAPMQVSDTGEILIKEDDAIEAIFKRQMLDNVLTSILEDTKALKELRSNTG